MDVLYKRDHHYKKRRSVANCIQTDKGTFKNPEMRPSNNSEMELTNHFKHHHRLSCPNPLECCECSRSEVRPTSVPNLPRKCISESQTNTDSAISNISKIIEGDGGTETNCQDHNHQYWDSNINSEHRANYDDNDDGVKTLANRCDNLRNCMENKLTEFESCAMSWKWEYTSKMHRFLTRFSGRRRPSRRRAFSWLPVIQWTRMTSFLYTFFILVTTCLPNLPVSYACSSRSTPKPRPPSPTLRPNITIQTWTCPAEYDAHYCLNGATCFTVKIGESILYNCECAEGYMGQRCEFKDLDGSYLPSKQRAMLEQAGVTGGLAIAVVIMFSVCLYLYVYSRRKSQLRRLSRQGDAVDGVDQERYERRPFDPYYYNNPSFSISERVHPSTLHHQPMPSTSARVQMVEVGLSPSTLDMEGPSTSKSHFPKKVEPPDPPGPGHVHQEN